MIKWLKSISNRYRNRRLQKQAFTNSKMEESTSETQKVSVLVWVTWNNLYHFHRKRIYILRPYNLFLLKTLAIFLT